MILEGIVTTQNAEGTLNIAPMGPCVDSGMQRFILRPFQSSTTFRNLSAIPEGVLHVTDDALMLARAAIGLELDPPRRPADVVRGQILTSACRYYEFRVLRIDDVDERASIEAETVAHGDLRPFFGWNRAKHAVLEAAILATRVGILPQAEIRAQIERLQPWVNKTGGPDEHAAFALLLEHTASSTVLSGPVSPQPPASAR